MDPSTPDVIPTIPIVDPIVDPVPVVSTTPTNADSSSPEPAPEPALLDITKLFTENTPDIDSVPIVLVDATGSVKTNYESTTTVFDKIKQVIQSGVIPEKRFRMLFWNSTPDSIISQGRVTGTFFKDGIWKIPYVVDKDKLDTPFNMVSQNITNGCLTFPHVAFMNVTPEWCHTDKPTRIYFVTDGQIGYQSISRSDMTYLKTKLADSIQSVFKRFYNIQLTIITVESKQMDFGQLETLNSAAGCDVYTVIMENHLTDYITKFISFTPNNPTGFIHINKLIPPKGFVPYETKIFSELKTLTFIKYIKSLIDATTDPDAILKIVQNLSTTLVYLTKDKPPKIINEIISTFCRLFDKEGSEIDRTFVRFILTDAITKERTGTAQLFANYRAQMKDLYKQAAEMIKKDVSNAIGVNQILMSIPMDIGGKSIILCGSSQLNLSTLNLKGTIYPQSTYNLNGLVCPILPCDLEGFRSLMMDQCLRQWTRVVVGHATGINYMDDKLIFVMLGYVLQVVLTENIPLHVKKGYQKLGEIMLKKKRLNKDVTELSRLEEGDLPTPNSGQIADFYKYMGAVSTTLSITRELKPLTLWYAICLALGNANVASKQLIHCRESIQADFPDISPEIILDVIAPLVPKLSIVQISLADTLEYQCPITLEDTSKTGGFQIKAHRNYLNHSCHPRYVLSETGYTNLLKERPMCPVCYADLNTVTFVKVTSKPAESIDSQLPSNLTDYNIFGSTGKAAKIAPVAPSITPGTTSGTTSGTTITIVLKGVVGAGKSTMAEELQKEFEKAGFYCISEGIDKYCRAGKPKQQAVKMVTGRLNQILKHKSIKKVAIIDTCGERDTDTTNVHFGVNFGGWTKIVIWPNLIRNDLTGYFTWSLRNVLKRTKPTSTSNFNLNPIDAGVSKCVEVHKIKATALFGNAADAMLPILASTTAPIATIIQSLDEVANNYELRLASEMKMKDEIVKAIGHLL